MPEVTQALLVEILDYCEATGRLWWKPRGPHLFENGRRWSAQQIANTFNAKFAGEEVGAVNPDGYRTCRMFGKAYKVHRLIWRLKEGDWPDEVDHIDGIRDNNRWHNLRNVSHQENARNMKRSLANTSGHTGVSWIAREGCWQAYIGGRSLGYFQNFQDAVRAREVASKEYDYHENHGNVVTR